LNGSPRGPQGNTALMISHFLRGSEALDGRQTETFHLFRTAGIPEYVRAFEQAELVLLGFPLYTDAMPGLVKEFIDALAPLAGRKGNPAVLFFVQSGFPEAAHSRPVEAYLRRLAELLGCDCLGVIVKGGGEGIRSMPDKWTAPMFAQFEALGRGLAETGALDARLVKQIAGCERYPRILAPLFKLVKLTGLLDFYWKAQMKENGVTERALDRPYEE